MAEAFRRAGSARKTPHSCLLLVSNSQDQLKQQAASSFLLNVPSRLGERQWRCQTVGIRRIGIDPNRSIFRSGEKLP
jgi:hypothetical protein